VMEVTKSIEAYRAADPGATLDQVVIGGDTGVEEKLAEAIHRRLGIATELYNPAAAFGWDPDEGANAIGFAPTLGLVLDQADETAVHFDFLHPKKMVSTTKARLKKAPWVAAVVALFVTATAVAGWQYTKADRVALGLIEQQIEELKKDSSNQKKFLKLVEQIRDFDEDQLVWIDEWYDVFTLLPSNQELVVDHLEMNQKDRRIKLKTRATEGDTANRLVQTLESFRRDGRDKPRFKVTIGTQSEKKGEQYPFVQDVFINILKDEPSRKRSRRADD